MREMPEIFVLAGPNGAGKSTVATAVLPRRFRTERFLNADSIAKVLAITSQLESSRLMLERMHSLRDQHQTFAIETTLAGRTLARFLRDSQIAGYRVHVAYVWIANVELAAQRVAVRVQRGGHDVPRADIERRYWRGLANFLKIYRLVADRWVLCDNSGSEMSLVARGRKNRPPVIYDAIRYEHIEQLVGKR